MRNIINRISDRALGIVLREASAGACITQTGQVCKCLSEASCGDGKSTYKVYRVECHGQCALSQTVCEASCVVTV
ncbi:MAG TPA: hypothetical protein VIZ00_16945 [Streptosporangiaceae bacterium]